MMSKEIYLRPHHGLCIILFDPLGHSTQYSSIMCELTEFLSNEPTQEIVLCSDLDVICGYCPHNNNGICNKSDEVTGSDNCILSYCGLKAGQRLLWEDLKQQLTDNILKVNELMRACKGCQYLSQCEVISGKQVQNP